MRSLTLTLLAACWAPEVQAPPREVASPAGAPAEVVPTEAPRAVPLAPQPAESAARPAAPVIAPPPTTIPASTRLPTPPFTAWTTDAPLTLVGPGGRTVTTLGRVGVRVEVLQVLPARVRVQAQGCADTDCWLPRGKLRAAGDPGTHGDPLSVALMQRARWAGRRDLPDGAGPMCALIDDGFTLRGTQARWERADGELVLGWDGEAWQVRSAHPPSQAGGDCRTLRGLASTPAAP